MDRFVIADNPMSGSGQMILVQTIKPVTLIECIPGLTVPKGYHYIHCKQQDLTGYSHMWTLRVHYSQTDDLDQIYKLLTKAWHWYFSYLQKLTEWEKENDPRQPYYFVKRPSK